ncbi:MAG: aminoglycoside phosphotransferase family protein [Pseudomonadota bacterium]
MEITLDLAQRLVADQFPEFSELSIEPVASGGTDNAIFRLGPDLSLRLPKRLDAVGQVEKEQIWLPRLSPLPLRIPKPVKQGAPSQGYPHPWSIYDWCPGSPLFESAPKDWPETVDQLAEFLKVLQSKDTMGAPKSGAQNHFRGVELERRDPLTRGAIDGVSDLYDAATMTSVWETSFAAPKFAAEPVWLHGDLQGGNLLVAQGQLAAVIDFGLSGIGDPACDLIVAWSVLPAAVRSRFRVLMDCDDAMWQRGKGWALSVAVIALDYYRDRNARLSAISRQTIEAVLEPD